MLALHPRVVTVIWAAIKPRLPVVVDEHPLGCHRPRRDDFARYALALVGYRGNLRILFQTLPLTRANMSNCCGIDNNEWTLWDGFQTLPNVRKSWWEGVSRTRGKARSVVCDHLKRSPRPPDRSRRRIRDGFQTPLPDPCSGGFAAPPSTCWRPNTKPGVRCVRSPKHSASITAPSPRTWNNSGYSVE